MRELFRAIADYLSLLRANPRGPALLEDLILREKIFHFDHERIPERVVQARGSAGSVDTPRDVRGFAVKCHTKEGNRDLSGNNIPVFFIQDAIRFPNLAHAVKMEPDRAFPQAATAHDTFRDYMLLTPGAMHMVMWAMSDRTLPRSLRMMEGFGIDAFRLLDKAAGMEKQGVAPGLAHSIACVLVCCVRPRRSHCAHIAGCS